LKKNYKVIIHFDGYNYSGWQYQTPPIDTIQFQIQKALKIIAKKKITVTGSSRTDAGVHSSGLTANFVLPIDIKSSSLQKAMNSLLPLDIRIACCEQVDPSFNARFQAKSKTYVYRICNGQYISPFVHRYVNHIPYPLDLNKMRKASKFFVGCQDFSSFTSDEPNKNRIREISSLTLQKKKDLIIFTIKGKSFLRYMVRNIVGTIIDVGRGKIELKAIPDIFAAKNRIKAGRTAKSHGLTLEKVEY
jgi:tRNA pseudouridine38-40 synthase